MGGSLAKSRLDAAFVVRMVGIVLFAYFFFGFMLLPCLNTLTSIFTTTNAEGVRDPFAVIRFFFAGSMGRYVWNSLKLAICLVVTVNVVGSTAYFRCWSQSISTSRARTSCASAT